MEYVAKNFCQLTTTELYEILKARTQVFLLEQDIRCQDMDDVDYKSRHYFLEENGKVMAYLRAFYADDSKKIVKIGRVLTVNHGIGLGAEIMNKAISDIRKTMPCECICLHSQKYAIGFYEKFGFKSVSEEFLEEGILHVAMQLES